MKKSAESYIFCLLWFIYGCLLTDHICTVIAGVMGVFYGVLTIIWLFTEKG